MRTRRLLLLVALSASLAASCSRDHGHEHDKAKGHDQEEASVAITHYTSQTELFVEFPALVFGKDAEFVAHLTRLADFKPVAEGTLVVTLSGAGQPEERGESRVSGTPGIFKPLLAPQHAGKRTLSFTLTAAGMSVKHEVGAVEVHPNEKVAKAAAHAADAGIRYTKEQQWRTEFAVEVTAERKLRESIPVTALIRPRAAGEARIAAPVAGLLRPAPGALPQIGSRVSAGQVLAYLTPRLGGETDIATLDLGVSRSRIEAENAANDLERLEKLLQAEVVPEKRVVDARNRDRTTKAELAAAQRRIATYQGGAGGIALKSPVSGTIVSVGGSAGASFEAGQTIFHVADLGRLWLEAQVPESDLGRVGTPSGAFFKLDGVEQAFVLEVGANARLVAFGGQIHPETRTVPAIFEFDNPGGRLKSGMQVRAGLYTGNVAQGIAVPAAAVVDDSGQPVVFVQKEGETFERRGVATGVRDGNWIAITSGLAAGERVVTRGAWQVRLAASAPAQAGHGHAH